ncbi:hypothetical protein BX600DRAFT_435337 [Xylariales sp. PMI_506]|nr:hypothetical protein BX600DRAFT_435337 [Xylariales sp. PMI_506]
MSPTIVLITGASRGLGKELLKRYLALPNHVVIAANRNPADPNSQALSDLLVGEGSRLIVVKIDVLSEQDPFTAMDELKKLHDIHHLDVVIANAGISDVNPPVADLKLADLQAHIATNLYGVVNVYHATRPMLQKSTKEPMFVPMGSQAASLGQQPPIPNAAYGPSKVAVNWVTVRINAEDSWLNAFILTPALTDTDMGVAGARRLGIEKYLVGTDVCCDGMMEVLSSSTKEKHGGKMVFYTGEILGW